MNKISYDKPDVELLSVEEDVVICGSNAGVDPDGAGTDFEWGN